MRLSDIAKKMLWILCILFVILMVAGIAYYRSFAFFPFALGAFLGVALNIFKVIMIDRITKKIVDMEKGKASNYATVQHFLRFLLTGVILVLSAVLPFINIWGAAAGVLTFPIATFSVKHFTDHAKHSSKNTDD